MLQTLLYDLPVIFLPLLSSQSFELLLKYLQVKISTEISEFPPTSKLFTLYRLTLFGVPRTYFMIRFTQIHRGCLCKLLQGQQTVNVIHFLNRNSVQVCTTNTLKRQCHNVSELCSFVGFHYIRNCLKRPTQVIHIWTSFFVKF